MPGRKSVGLDPREGITLVWSCLLAIGYLAPQLQGAGVDVEDLRPGLVATFKDAAKPAPVEIVQLEPTIDLSWKSDEAAHPRLAANGGAVRWDGFLNVLRPGTYRFRVFLRGKFRLTVAGKEVLAGESSEEKAAFREGSDVVLEAGVQPLTAEFTRLPGPARVELFWQSPEFRFEPMAHDRLGHLPDRDPPQLKISLEMERGRFLAEERNCASCHQPADQDKIARGLLQRQGPDLSEIGKRAYPGWVFAWLEDPAKLRPGAVMPKMFTDDEAGQVERQAVAHYLATLGGPMPPKQKQPNLKEALAWVARGQGLFTSTGCVACHNNGQIREADSQPPRWFYSLNGAESKRPNFPLLGLGSKTTPEKLAHYLENPLAVDPGGRMPHMLLQGHEARELAHYLCQDKVATLEPKLPAPAKSEQILAAFQRVEPRAEERTAFQRLGVEAQLMDLGKRLVIDKGCNQCHTIAAGGKPFAGVLARASFSDLKKPENLAKGCLANESGKGVDAPRFQFSEADRRALRRFLVEGTSGAGSAAPAHAGRVALERFNCLACHARDGEGGLTSALAEELRRFDKAENAEAVSPPPLTGVAHKLRTPWVRQVLTQAGRARPWMGLRMPQFGDPNVARLPEAFAALEGTAVDDSVHKVPLSAAKIEAGRQLIGKQAFGCVSCHDLVGIVSTGTRGPDLSLMNQRVRYDWYRRWLEHAQRMQPGTHMPTYFPDGKSLLADVLGGSPDAQAEAMWAYLSLGSNLPLPDGLEPPRGLVLTVAERPILLRTFMPDAGTRAIAVGYPGGIATAFDAATCRLAYAWSGNFLDASPVWNERGGNPAKVMGPRFWTSPPGCPWEVSPSNDPPDFSSRAKDPAYGAGLPEGKVYDGPRELLFEGYSSDKRGAPTFHYRLHAGETQRLEVAERVEPIKHAVAAGLVRRFHVRVPLHQTPWLLAGESGQEPRLLDQQGAPITLDLKTGTVEVAAADRLLVLPQGGDRTLIVGLAEAPPGTCWHLRRLGGTWQALLRLPATKEASVVTVGLKIWAPYRDEPGLVKELISTK